MNNLPLLVLFISIIVLVSSKDLKCNLDMLRSYAAVKSFNSSGASAIASAVVAPDATDNYDNGDCNGAVECFKRAANKFAFQYLYEVIINDKYGTKYIAPLDTFYLTCHFALYTYGCTLKELLKFCGVKSKSEIRCALKITTTYSVNQPKGTEYVYGKNTVSNLNNNFTEQYKQEMIQLLKGRGLNYDFSDPVKVTEMLNEVIAEETNNRITEAIKTPSIFEEDDSDKSNKVLYASGINFRSKWKKAFDVSNITIRNYYDFDNKVCKVPYVYQYSVYNYTDDSILDAQFLSIPYVDGFFNVVVAFPNKKCRSDLIELVKKMEKPGSYKRVKKSMKSTRVEYLGPVYDNIMSYVNNVKVLKKVAGINSLLDPDMAQVRNSEGEIVNVYVADGYQTLKVYNVLSGVEPPPTKDDVSLEDLENLEKRTLYTNRPVLLLIENQDLVRIAAVGKVSCKECEN